MVFDAMNIVKTTECHLVAEYVNIKVFQSGSISKTTQYGYMNSHAKFGTCFQKCTNIQLIHWTMDGF